MRLPYSETFGSLLASSSPKRIVGRHVLLRLCVPRYPPLALSSLTCSFDFGLLSWFLLQFYVWLFSFYAVFKVLLLRRFSQHSLS
jgi:hypothetical protein